VAARDWTRETYVAFLSIASPELRGTLRRSRRACESAGQRHLTVVVPRWLDVWTTLVPSSDNRPRLVTGFPRQPAVCRTGRTHGQPCRPRSSVPASGTARSSSRTGGVAWCGLAGEKRRGREPNGTDEGEGPHGQTVGPTWRRCEPRDAARRPRSPYRGWSRGPTRSATDPRFHPASPRRSSIARR
jgi:hypothetical protein